MYSAWYKRYNRGVRTGLGSLCCSGKRVSAGDICEVAGPCGRGQAGEFLFNV